MTAVQCVRRTRIATTLVFVGASLVVGFSPIADAAPTVITDAEGYRFEVDPDDPGGGATAVGRGPGPHPTVAAIPGTVDHEGVVYDVKRIGVGAFTNVGTWANSVVIPPEVEVIHDRAFRRTSGAGLPTVTFSDGSALQAIGEYAFAYNALTAVELPTTMRTLGPNAFMNNEITSLRLNEGLEAVPDHAFVGNDLDGEVVIPDSVQSIGRYAFAHNVTLDSLVIGADTTSIGEYAFTQAFGPGQLAGIQFGSAVETIGKHAFSYNSLTSVTFPDSLRSIGDDAFWNNGMSTVTFGSGFETMGARAFSQNSIEHVVFPATLTAIGSQAFDIQRIDGVVRGPRTATMLGPIPTIVRGSGWGSFDGSRTWNDPATVTNIHYRAEFGADDETVGYTDPHWMDYPTIPLFPVTFDLNGHGDSFVVDVLRDELVAEPDDPTADGYAFSAWSASAEGDAGSFPFDDPIEEATTAYAVWEEEPASTPAPTPTAPVTSPGSTAPPASPVDSGPAAAEEPVDPQPAALQSVTLSVPATPTVAQPAFTG
ncbi:MAG: leucine-rich repeat protein [Acidimicrobiales bacterium]|nr:leucine-rich repeat protein [Acidimicrobiales bacterium]